MLLGEVVVLSIGLIVSLFRAKPTTERRIEGKVLRIADALYGEQHGLAAIGRRRGHRVLYRFAHGTFGRSSELWTEVIVELPKHYPLELHLRRQLPRDRKRIDHGELIDVEVGDPAFDPQFLVEAAPADVTRVLLDPEVRGYLLSHGQVRVDTTTLDGRSVLQLAIPDWRDDLAEALAAIDATVRIAERVRDAFAAVDAPPVATGSPFRTELDDQDARAAERARDEEIAALRALRARR